MNTQQWTAQEHALLRATYGSMTSRELQAANFPGRSASAIRKQAHKLGLCGPNNRWSDAENRVLRRWYGKIPVQDIHDKYLPGRTSHAIISHAVEIGMQNSYKTDWTDAEIAVLKANYQKVSPGEIQRLLPCHSLGSIKTAAYKLGLQDAENADERRLLQSGARHGANLSRVRSVKPNRNNTTGAKGIEYVKDRKKYRAVVRYMGKRKHLGYYATKDEAIQARDAEIRALEPQLQAIEADIRRRLADLG